MWLHLCEFKFTADNQKSSLRGGGTGNHNPDGPEASHALAFKLDQSMGLINREGRLVNGKK
jgi:hypothetical protein